MKKEKGFLTPTMWGILIVAALGLAAYGSFRYLLHDNQKLTQANAVQGVTIAVQNDTIDKSEKSAVINEAVTTAKVKNDQKIEDTHRTIQKKVDADVQRINQQAQVQEQKAPSAAEKEVIETDRINLVSATRIDGLWDQYCAATPSASGCVQTTPQAPAATVPVTPGS